MGISQEEFNQVMQEATGMALTKPNMDTIKIAETACEKFAATLEQNELDELVFQVVINLVNLRR